MALKKMTGNERKMSENRKLKSAVICALIALVFMGIYTSVLQRDNFQLVKKLDLLASDRDYMLNDFITMMNDFSLLNSSYEKCTGYLNKSINLYAPKDKQLQFSNTTGLYYITYSSQFAGQIYPAFESGISCYKTTPVKLDI